MREDEPGDKRLVAYVLPTQKREDIVSELRNHLKAKLPAYMLPSAFVVLDAWPLTSNGKVHRQALPRPNPSASHMDTMPIMPQTEIERMLAAIWQDILHIERIGIHDNFFELGGHSLLATRLLTRVNAIFKLDLPLRILFENATIVDLARQIVTAPYHQQSSPLPNIEKATRGTSIPLS